MPETHEKLLLVDEPHLVERYGRAMTAFDLKPPPLESFHVDMTGFSPEVAEALGNADYLDPPGDDRRFILVSPQQADLPVVHSSFSNTGDLMSGFFEKNRRVLYALTIKDVVFGEIEDNVFVIDDIDDLLSIEQVTFKIGTHEDLTGKTNELKRLIDRLLQEPDAWRNDAMLNRMVMLAGQTGDIRDNALVPEAVVFRNENFWTSHFGGTYLFNDERQITVICDPEAPGFRKSRPWEVAYLDIGDGERVFDFLEASGRLQQPSVDWLESSRLLELRKHMAAAWLAAQEGDEMPPSLINKTWVRRWARDNRRLVSNDNTLPLIEWVEKQTGDGKPVYMEDIDSPDRFALCRAQPGHPDMALVNRLISEYLPYDFITRYEFHRPLFVRERTAWNENYAEFVAEALNSTYLMNKARVYDELYL